MTKALAHITSKNCIASVQDKGRFGYRQYGVPTSGPMDDFSFMIANALLDNDENDGVLEIYNAPFAIKFEQHCLISVTGIDVIIMLNNVIIQDARTLSIEPNDELFLPYSKNSYWKYLGIKGGWQTPVVLGSRCTNASLDMKQITTNSALPYLICLDYINTKHATFQGLNRPIAIYPGPESHLYNQLDIVNVFDRDFTLDLQSSRMAYTFVQPLEIISCIANSINSSAVFPGIVQLTPSGKFFVLMKDCQTTGGYPRIGFIKSEDLIVLSQIKINGQVRFYYKPSESGQYQ